MLSDPRRLRTAQATGFLVSWRDKFRIETEDEARALVARILDDPENVAALRASLGADASDLELEEWLVTGLAGGGLTLVRTKRQPPTLDPPKVVDLVDLVDDARLNDDLRTHEVSFELVDRNGKPLQASYTIGLDGSPFRRGYLSPDGAVRIDQLGANTTGKALLTGVNLVTGDAGENLQDPPALPPRGEHFISFEVSRADGSELKGSYRLFQTGSEVGTGALAEAGRFDGVTSDAAKLVLKLEDAGS